MEGIELTEDKRVMSEAPFDISSYAKTMFQMFGGEETDVSIRFDNDLVGVVYDRFGIDVPVMRVDEDHFICRAKVAVSPHFLSWIISFGDKVKIMSPQSVIDDLYELAAKAKSNYD